MVCESGGSKRALKILIEHLLNVTASLIASDNESVARLIRVQGVQVEPVAFTTSTSTRTTLTTTAISTSTQTEVLSVNATTSTFLSTSRASTTFLPEEENLSGADARLVPFRQLTLFCSLILVFSLSASVF